MKSIRLMIYSIAVLGIQLLGRIAERSAPMKKRRTVNSRVLYGPYEQDPILGKIILLVCCDCSSSHIIWKANEGIYGIPTRPEGYNYKYRLPVDACFADDNALEKQDLNR